MCLMAYSVEPTQIYELATAAETGLIYALMTDGEVRVYDVAAPLGCTDDGGGMGGPRWTCQLITHDPTPRELGSERRHEYRQWCETVGLGAMLGEWIKREWTRCVQSCVCTIVNTVSHCPNTVVGWG